MQLPKNKITRDLALFLLGFSGVIYETVVSEGDRPTLLILFGACLGLPVFLNSDEAKARINKENEPPPLTPTPGKPDAEEKKEEDK